MGAKVSLSSIIKTKPTTGRVHTPVTSQLRKQRQEDFKFKFNLGTCVKLMMIMMVITMIKILYIQPKAARPSL